VCALEPGRKHGPPLHKIIPLFEIPWGLVLEKNWSSRAKFALESNLNYNQRSNASGFNVMVEFDYLLSYYLSARVVSFYSDAVVQGQASHQARSPLETIS
jgi:hypothetical protein